MVTKAQIIESMIALPREDRAELADRLILGLDEKIEDPAQVEKEWSEEVEKRSNELASGQVSAVPWQQALREIKEELGRGDAK